MRAVALQLLLFLLFAEVAVPAQQSGASTTPQATVLATSALTALTGAIQVSDVTLTGTGMRTVGPDVESGNFTLKALGQYQSRFDLVVSSGTRTELFNLGDTRQGFWNGTDGVVHPMANHNCISGEVWFFPALSVLSLVSNENFAFTYIGPEVRNSVSVQHIQIVQLSSEGSVTGQFFSTLSATDVYLDSSSYLPVAMTFNVHPDDAANTNIPVEIDFLNYEPVHGVQIPFHIRKFVNGSLLLDLSVQSAELNTGLTTATFSSY
jgi:hypothetical protein